MVLTRSWPKGLGASNTRKSNSYLGLLSCFSIQYLRCQAANNINKRDSMSLQAIIDLETNEVGRRIVSGGCHPAERKNGDFAALRRLGKTATLRLFGGCHLTERSWMESLSRVYTTTPCSIDGWPLVTWKGSGAHVPLSI
ncbi:unnamed protein product [Spirodela intermedia]|uniref:Uncharacterized protein n=1 Tax=Spirodela intermedia TaxID=51605 RepID=A0A7I8KFA6_SPIIN|nr:unnamed protein product [Spirodela intermedia]